MDVSNACSDFFAKRMNKKSKIKKLMIDGFDFTLLYCFLHSQLTARAFWSDEIFSGQAGVFCTMQKKSDFYSSVFFFTQVVCVSKKLYNVVIHFFSSLFWTLFFFFKTRQRFLYYYDYS